MDIKRSNSNSYLKRKYRILAGIQCHTVMTCVCGFFFFFFFFCCGHQHSAAPIFFFAFSFIVCSGFLFGLQPLPVFFVSSGSLFCLQRSFFVCSDRFSFAAHLFCLQRSFFVFSESSLFAACHSWAVVHTLPGANKFVLSRNN